MKKQNQCCQVDLLCVFPPHSISLASIGSLSYAHHVLYDFADVDNLDDKLLTSFLGEIIM